MLHKGHTRDFYFCHCITYLNRNIFINFYKYYTSPRKCHKLSWHVKILKKFFSLLTTLQQPLETCRAIFFFFNFVFSNFECLEFSSSKPKFNKINEKSSFRGLLQRGGFNLQSHCSFSLGKNFHIPRQFVALSRGKHFKIKRTTYFKNESKLDFILQNFNI